jgi:hypothetical protein
MRRRRDREALRPVSAVTRIQNDLERRGIPRNFSGAVAARLERAAASLNETEYGALLDGVAAAYGVHRELKKLDEGLQILSSYVLRIRDRTGEGKPGVVH